MATNRFERQRQAPHEPSVGFSPFDPHGYVLSVGLVPSYGLLVAVQAALVLAPGKPRRLASSRALGLVIPAAAMAIGVTLASSTGGADFLTALAAIVTPILAAGAGWARGWRHPWLAALAVPALYALAWLRPDHLDGEAAGLALICGACLAVTGVVAALAPHSWLVVGLILLVVLDIILVWGDRSVEPAMNTLQAATPPAIGRPLPSLQQAVLGDATMGWLDFAAPALLGLLVVRRVPAAAATAVAGGRGGLLLVATSPIAATPPVLAGLAAGYRRRSAGVSTSPGAPRSSQGTGSAGRSRRPSSGTSPQAERPISTGWSR
jgi:hypothetical protein